MTRIAFVADRVAFESDEHAAVCAVYSQHQGLSFQRDAEGAKEDWGHYLEFGGQQIGAYGCVAESRIGSASLRVDLSQPLGSLAEVTGFDVELRLDPTQKALLSQGLRIIFRGELERLGFDD